MLYYILSIIELNKCRQYFSGLFSHYLVYDITEILVQWHSETQTEKIDPMGVILHNMKKQQI